jgi:6-pyruvoyl-tetrahydropterin synthase
VDDKLSVKIVADVSDLKKELDKVGKHVDKFALNAKKDMKDFSQSVALATVKFQELTNIAKSSAAAVYEFMRAQIDSSRETALWASRLDIAVDTFSQLVVVGRKFGATADDVGDSIKDLNERIADAARGNKTFAEAFGIIGLSANKLLNMPVEEQFIKVADAIGKMTNAGDRNFVTATLMADAGFRLIPMFQKGAGAIREMMIESDRLGQSLKPEEIEKFNNLNKEFLEMGLAAETLGKAVAQRLEPAFSKLAVAVTNAANAMTHFLNASADLAEAMRRVREESDKTNKSFAAGNTIASGASLSLSGLSMAANQFAEETNGMDRALMALEDTIDNSANLDVFGAQLEELAKQGKSVAEVFQNVEPNLIDGSFGPQLPSTENDAMMIVEKMKTDFLAEQLEERVRLNKEYINSIGKDQYDFNAALRQQEVDQQQATRMIWESGWKGKADIMGDIMGNMSSLMNSESRKMFEIGKVAATASAIIETISSAQKAFSAMAAIPVVGPALGTAAAAAAVLAGMVRVQQIQATTFGSKSVGGGAGGGVAGTPQPQDVINTTNVDISLQGDRFGGDSVRSMLGAINSAIADGGKIGAINVR